MKGSRKFKIALLVVAWFWWGIFAFTFDAGEKPNIMPFMFAATALLYLLVDAMSYDTEREIIGPVGLIWKYFWPKFIKFLDNHLT